MIQRKQTLWLILSLVALILSFSFPFATGQKLDVKTGQMENSSLNAVSDFIILILSIAGAAIAAITIFLYKDRKVQMRLCLLGFLIAVGIMVLYILGMKKLEKVTPALWAILPLAAIAGFYMAWRGIRHDERLVKSLNKLR